MTSLCRALALVGLVAIATGMSASAQQVIAAGSFSARGADSGLPPDWKPLTFRKVERHTRYTLVNDGGVTVLKAESAASASGLMRRFDERVVELKDFPILRWRWKVAGLVKGADIRSREGDDYPARIYVVFRYDPERPGVGASMRMQYGLAKSLYGEYPPHASLNYVWDGRAPAGTMLPNAYTARAMMFVVESGAARVGEWVSVERDVYADYRRAFNEEPPPVAGIAVMTDTDQTGESAVAWYGDIELRARR
ncbi:MAG: DUF3047 domain-containing protein [Burkholderiales bacterium]|nr:DUF3047 domain-containing protein [Burkholderiales bacterium]